MEENSHRVYGYVSEKVFYGMLNEAKRENIFTNAEGRVDVGALIAELVTTFSEGRYFVKMANKVVMEVLETIESEPAPIVDETKIVEKKKTSRKKASKE